MGWGEEPEGNRRPLPISELMCAAMEATMERRLAAAHAKGCVLRYVGVINLDGTTSLGLREVELDHPYANLRGPELCIRFFSTRYARAALVRAREAAHARTLAVVAGMTRSRSPSPGHCTRSAPSRAFSLTS